MTTFTVSELFAATNYIDKLAIRNAKRSFHDFASGQLIIDRFESNECLFVRLNGGNQIELICEGSYTFQQIDSGGYLGLPLQSNKPFLWIPQLPVVRKTNQQKQIISEHPTSFSGLGWADHGASFTLQAPESAFLDFIIWRFPPEFSIEDISSLSPTEVQGYFLWGSHSQYKKPADLYIHLIHGHIYENRLSWPHYWKTFSENDAHALYVALNGLEKITGKVLYTYLKEQVLLSVIDRQNDEGAWLHGMWTKHMECHYRLHCSGMHMLMDALSERKDPVIETALGKAAAFIASKATEIDAGKWFLHDSLETNDETIKEHPGGRYASNALGKSNSNLLVLNTHLDTAIALDRYATLTGDSAYDPLVRSARKSTQTILSLQPAEFLYRIIFKMIYWTWLPQNKAADLPIVKRLLKRIGWKYLIPKIHWLKARFPRIVMPGGYIDRTIGAKGLADQYHVINLMDLLRYKHCFPDDNYDSLIHDALEFTYQSGIVDYWSEQESKRYALGFWVECLYLADKIYQLPKYHTWITEALLKLEHNNLGLSPSLLGGNYEANSAGQAHIN